MKYMDVLAEHARNEVFADPGDGEITVSMSCCDGHKVIALVGRPDDVNRVLLDVVQQLDALSEGDR